MYSTTLLLSGSIWCEWMWRCDVNLNGHSTAVGHLIQVKLQPSPKQGTAPSWHLYPGGDSGVRSSWVECLEVMTWDFSGDSRLLKWQVWWTVFFLDPSQLSRRRGPVKSCVRRGDSLSVCRPLEEKLWFIMINRKNLYICDMTNVLAMEAKIWFPFFFFFSVIFL